MTKFSTIADKPKNETVFTRVVDSSFNIRKAGNEARDFENVVFIGHDRNYGDVFKAYNNGKENDFCLFFGDAGDEFNI